jgi:hypothetical protein
MTTSAVTRSLCEHGGEIQSPSLNEKITPAGFMKISPMAPRTLLKHTLEVQVPTICAFKAKIFKGIEHRSPLSWEVLVSRGLEMGGMVG